MIQNVIQTNHVKSSDEKHFLNSGDMKPRGGNQTGLSHSLLESINIFGCT